MDSIFFEFCIIFLFGIFMSEVFSIGEVVFVVNSGGLVYIDLNGVYF